MGVCFRKYGSLQQACLTTQRHRGDASEHDQEPCTEDPVPHTGWNRLKIFFLFLIKYWDFVYYTKIPGIFFFLLTVISALSIARYRIADGILSHLIDTAFSCVPATGTIANIHQPGVYPDEETVCRILLVEMSRTSTFIDKEQEFRGHIRRLFLKYRKKPSCYPG